MKSGGGARSLRDLPEFAESQSELLIMQMGVRKVFVSIVRILLFVRRDFVEHLGFFARISQQSGDVLLYCVDNTARISNCEAIIWMTLIRQRHTIIAREVVQLAVTHPVKTRKFRIICCPSAASCQRRMTG